MEEVGLKYDVDTVVAEVGRPRLWRFGIYRSAIRDVAESTRRPERGIM
jgi:hypothetical protein